VLDFATFIYNAASNVSQLRGAIRRHDVEAARAAVVALRDLGDGAGAERMAALCEALYGIAGDSQNERSWDAVDAIVAALVEELEHVTGELELSRSA
jgi:hypothetical protein